MRNTGKEKEKDEVHTRARGAAPAQNIAGADSSCLSP